MIESTFSLMVVGNDWENQIKPFMFDFESPRHLEYTKSELTAKAKKRRYWFLEDNKQATKWHIENGGSFCAYYDEIAKKTDDELYEELLKSYMPENIDSDGNVYSTRNLNGKIDKVVRCVNILSKSAYLDYLTVCNAIIMNKQFIEKNIEENPICWARRFFDVVEKIDDSEKITILECIRYV